MSVSAAAREAVMRTKGPVGSLGGAWMSSPEEEAASEATGLDGWQLYFLGRHGVLGDVDPDVVLAAAYVFPADHLRREWAAARAVMTPEEALDRYLAVCHDWSQSRLAGFSGAERLADLAQRVIDASDVIGLPLFAGWRALPTPSGDDDASVARRCGHVCQVLREHRGACHGLAMAALQLDPLLAILTNPDGDDPADNATDYGWEPPFPVPSDVDRALRAQVEALTDDLVARAYDALTPEELTELVSLLEAAHTRVFD
jgi:hypothetical protein